MDVSKILSVFLDSSDSSSSSDSSNDEEIMEMCAKHISGIQKSKRIWKKSVVSSFWEHSLQVNGVEYFKEHLRMTPQTFDILCTHMKAMERQDTNYRKAIPLRKRVALGVYALASSAEYKVLAGLFGVGKSTVSEVVKDFCDKVWRVLRPQYLNTIPLTATKLKECIDGFGALGMVQCFGAIDGSHIQISPPAAHAVDYHNYKGWNSMVLLALVDHRYRFMYINVGAPGRCNDSKIFEESRLKAYLSGAAILKENNQRLTNVTVPPFKIGDSAFRLSEYLQKPYPFRLTADQKQKKYNYVLSKCRRVTENAFAHLKGRFRRIGKGIESPLDAATNIIKACCVLHNFLNEHNDTINQNWLRRQQEHEHTNNIVQPANETVVGDSNPEGGKIRDAICEYMSGTSADDDDASISSDVRSEIDGLHEI